MHPRSERVLPLIAMLMLAVTLAASGLPLASVAGQQPGPVTNYLSDSAEVKTLDPQRADDYGSINVVENLFLGLTNYDPVNPGNIIPELATEWTVSDDGTVWTFTLRDDVPWVRWDAEADRAEVLRMVTAQDVAYGFQRACDPRLSARYSSMAGQVIKGCDTLLETPPAALDDPALAKSLYEGVQAVALDDTTFQVTLQFPAGYFFGQTPMWIYRPVPREIVEEYGEDWTDISHIVTNGPFVVDEWEPDSRRVFVRNPEYPADLFGPGNVERIEFRIVSDPGTQFSLYQSNQIDVGPAPTADVQAILADPVLSQQLVRVPDLGVYYFGFAEDKSPTDNVHVRRAFSAAVDRAAFIKEIAGGGGEPMIHFTPPGMLGAPPIDTIGVGYDPDFARAEIEKAGYPNCEGLPPLEILTFSGASEWASFIAASIERELGCDPNNVVIEQASGVAFDDRIDSANPPEDRPHMWTLGWLPDYADANNWVNDVLSCTGQNDFNRPCSDVDNLILEAAGESDPDQRAQLYSRIEELFFGPEGVQPIIPLYLSESYALLQPWYEAPVQTDGLLGGTHWDWTTIDQAAQQAARGG